jgi:hypothetical protein
VRSLVDLRSTKTVLCRSRGLLQLIAGSLLELHKGPVRILEVLLVDLQGIDDVKLVEAGADFMKLICGRNLRMKVKMVI